MRSSESSDCVKSLIKLKQQEVIIEKALDNFVDCMKLEPEILRVLQGDRHSRAKLLSNSPRASALEITGDMRAIKSTIGGLQQGHKIDVDNFRSKLMALADKIREFKKNFTIDDLTREETELDRYLHEFSLNSAKYETRRNSTGPVAVPRESSRKTLSAGAEHQDYREIRDFEALIAKTGHTQNWSEEDHLFFLKIRKSARNVPAMVAAIRKRCPDITAERIVNHEAWYKIYVDLREKQRKNVREWRDRRELERRRKSESAIDAKNPGKSAETREKKSNPENDTKESAADASKKSRDFSRAKDSSANRKRESLARWRLDRENSRALENERTKSESEARRIFTENRRLSRARRLKAAVDVYRERRAESLASSSATSVTDADRVTAKFEGARLIESFRRQDEEFLERRKVLLASRKQNPSGLVRRKTREKVDGQSTLLKPTKVWLEKCRRGENRSELPGRVLYVKDIPKLATCDWRNRESSENSTGIPS